MRMSENPAGDVLETRSGGGYVALFGLPFFAAGILMIGVSLGMWGPAGGHTDRYVLLAAGAIFASVGSALVFGRRGLRLDKREGIVTEWWGLLVPFNRKEMPLAAFRTVSIGRELRSGRSSTYEVYPVSLTGDQSAVVLEEPQDYAEARRTAECVAGFLGLDLVDASAGRPVRRSPDELDLPLRARLERAGAMVEVPEPPPGIRTRCEMRGGRVVLALPRAGFAAAQFLGPVMTVIGTAIMIGVFIFATPVMKILRSPGPLRLFALGLLCVPMSVAILVAAANVLSAVGPGARVVVSRDVLEVHRPRLLGWRVSAIPAAEIEELIVTDERDVEEEVSKVLDDKRISPALRRYVEGIVRARLARSPCIIARSDRATLKFAEGLPESERRWIHAVVMKMLTA